jgi:hypothetical protein
MSGAFLLSVGILLFVVCGEIAGQWGERERELEFERQRQLQLERERGRGHGRDDTAGSMDERWKQSEINLYFSAFRCYEQPPTFENLTPRENAKLEDNKEAGVDKKVEKKCPKVLEKGWDRHPGRRPHGMEPHEMESPWRPQPQEWREQTQCFEITCTYKDGNVCAFFFRLK